MFTVYTPELSLPVVEPVITVPGDIPTPVKTVPGINEPVIVPPTVNVVPEILAVELDAVISCHLVLSI